MLFWRRTFLAAFFYSPWFSTTSTKCKTPSVLHPPIKHSSSLADYHFNAGTRHHGWSPRPDPRCLFIGQRHVIVHYEMYNNHLHHSTDIESCWAMTQSALKIPLASSRWFKWEELTIPFLQRPSKGNPSWDVSILSLTVIIAYCGTKSREPWGISLPSEKRNGKQAFLAMFTLGRVRIRPRVACLKLTAPSKSVKRLNGMEKLQVLTVLESLAWYAIIPSLQQHLHHIWLTP